MTNNSEQKLNREFSYPSIKQGADGNLHIAYTWYRQAIKYVGVSPQWVEGEAHDYLVILQALQQAGSAAGVIKQLLKQRGLFAG